METSSRRLSFQTDGSDLRSFGDTFGTVRKSILKKQSFIDVHDDLERALEASASVRQETPEQWFQRIMQEQSLSPLDLCDPTVCFGDARKHRLVPLKSVCERLFELDPGNDPLTETMEDFLFRFSFDQGDGEIVIDIKEALRTLDIWKTTAPRSPLKHDKEAIGSPRAMVSPAKAAMLQVKAEKLKQVVSSLQLENLRLSRALETGESPSKNEQRAPSPLKIAVKKPAHDAKANTSSSNSSSSPSKPQSAPKVVSRHEQELIALANRLEYDGVKKLEELLAKSDTAGAGFVSLKQLRWLLAHECQGGGDITESRLMELCMGMNFNAQAHLDYKEFVRVLLDILIYESRPPSRSSSDSRANSPSLREADDAALVKVREYLKGFYGSRENTRELLEQLCEKYDLEGNQSLSLAEMARVFQTDLTSQHPGRLKFPLTASETKRLLSSLGEVSTEAASQRSSHDGESTDFLYYPAIIAMIFRVDSNRSSSQDASAPMLMARVVQPEFWQALRRALCSQNDNPNLERKIHAQLCKILAKLDPKQSFGIAQRHFVRVFDQHWSARDLELLAKALASPFGRGSVSGWIRYDVLMKMVFGAPDLRDASTLTEIVQKLQQTARVWREGLMMASHGRHAHKSLSYVQIHELLGGGNNALPLNVTEFLYLVAHIKDGNHRVDTQKLWTLLTSEIRPASSGRDGNQSTASPSSSQFVLLRQCLRVLCDEHDLEKTLGRRARHEHGVVRLVDLTQELLAQLRVLHLSPQDKSQVTEECIESFLDALAHGDDATSPTADSLYVHALMDAIFDWDGLISVLRLPDRLVDVKKTLELFDWHKNGSIDSDDWDKAWRQLTVGTESAKQRTASPLHDWEIRVLVHRFPAAMSDKSARRSLGGLRAIDYSRLLVFLLEKQHRGAREQLKEAVCLLLQRVCARVTQGKTHMTTFHLEQAFEQIDRDGKGYFQIGDLRSFVLRELELASESGMDVHALRSYASQGTAMESVMQFLVGNKGKERKKVVSLMRFQELVNHGFFQPGQQRSRESRTSGSRRSPPEETDDSTNGSTDDSSETMFEPRRSRSRSSSQPRIEAHITLLRDLEQCIIDIAKQFTDSHGQISPADTYNHLNGTTKQAEQHQHRRPRSQSPVRSSFQSSPRSVASTSSHASRRLSCTTPSSTIDPLTASRLKQTLRSLHGVETSTHLIGQFFLRLGSTTKHFLELAVFAKWIAPLSVDMQSRVKQIVREMLAKSKSGGGHVDLERFLGALSRRMHDALATEAAMIRSSSHSYSQRRADTEPPLKVKPGVLLTRLHQLNVSMRKPEMTQLLRHFGLDDQHEIDYTEFVRRVYELAHQLPMQ